MVDFDNKRINSQEFQELTETGISAGIVNESADSYILADANSIGS